MKNIASQLYTPHGIIRELSFTAPYQRVDLASKYQFLDISDTVFSEHSSYKREVTCNYTILASDFMNRIEFTKLSSRGIIYFQRDNESDILVKLIFGKMRSQPDFLVFRVREEFLNKTGEINEFPFMRDIVLKSFKTLVRLGSRYFPGLCKGKVTILNCMFR
jgi:hypothetical protein